jgi:putative membrane protein
MLDADDHGRVHRAIAEAETRTAGEIFCIVAKESAAYREVPIAWAALVAFIGPPLMLLAGLHPAAVIDQLNSGWTIAHSGAIEQSLLTGAGIYALVQAALFAVTLAIVAIPAVRRMLTPGFVKAAHVHARATELFVHRRHASGAPATIMIYASSAERRVEIVGDDDIHAAVGEAFWKAAVQTALEKIKSGDAADGLIAAVTMCGDALAKHFPPTGAPREPTRDDVTEV